MLSDRTNVDFEMHSLSNFLTIDTGFHGSNKDDITGGKDRDFLDIEHVEVVQSVVSSPIEVPTPKTLTVYMVTLPPWMRPKVHHLVMRHILAHHKSPHDVQKGEGLGTIQNNTDTVTVWKLCHWE